MPILQNDSTTTNDISCQSSETLLLLVDTIVNNNNDNDRRGLVPPTKAIMTRAGTSSSSSSSLTDARPNDDTSSSSLPPPPPIESSVVVTTQTTTSAESEVVVVDRRSLRLYSKKHRVYVFREFILQTYSDYLDTTTSGSSSSSSSSTITNTNIILDIAGGKGDLSWILHNIDNYQSIVMDPRCTINHIHKSVEYLRRFPDECSKRAIPHQSTYQPLAALMPMLEQKNYSMESPLHIRIFVDDELIQVLRSIVTVDHDAPIDPNQWVQYWTKATQRTIDHITPSGKNDFSIDRVSISEDSNNNNITDAQMALQYILQAKLIVGYHPDQATDACFTLAQLLNIPVCVVPCCVFPSEFPHRRLLSLLDDTTTTTSTSTSTSVDDNDNNNHNENSDESCYSVTSGSKPVETYDDLIQYLLQQHPYLKMETLDFPGTTTARRIVLYTSPPDEIVNNFSKNE